MNINNINIVNIKESLLETPFSISKVSNSLNDSEANDQSDLLSLSKSKEASRSASSSIEKKQKIDSSYTPSVCNYYDKSNAETPCSLNVDSINEVAIKKVNLNTIYNNMGSSEDFVVIKSNNGMIQGSTKKTPIKYTKRQCANGLEKKNLMEKFTNSAKSGSVFYKEKKKSFDVNNFVVERNGNIEIINESEDEDKKDTIVEKEKINDNINHYSKFSFDITTNNESSVKEKLKKETFIPNNCNNLFKKRNSVNLKKNNNSYTRSFSSKSSKSKSSSKDKHSNKNIYSEVNTIIANNIKKLSLSSKKSNTVKKPNNIMINKNFSSNATASLIKQIKSSALAQKNNMKFISNPVNTTNKSKSRSKSKSNHQKIKTQINLQSVLSKFNLFSNRDSKRKSINSLSSLHDIILSENKKNLVNASSINMTNTTNIINNNTIIAKAIPTQETINTTGNNNYTAANTTISSVKKSPKVIQDFSFYKKKNAFNTHFISKTHHSSLVNNENNATYKVPLNKKCPIVSIKLKKLTGDNDTITGEF